jgi:hypothetical protein
MTDLRDLSDDELFPDYMDDGETEAFVRFDLASTADKACAFARAQQLIKGVDWQNVDAVWMKLSRDREWYYTVYEPDDGVVRYWRLNP